MSGNVTDLTDETFEDVIANSTEPVVVDFWAEWCGPCKQIAPILEQIADEQVGTLKITKLNIDQNPATAMKFNVMSIPTMLVFEGGQLTKKVVGAKRKDQLIEEFGL